jgi:hypothetical protein
MTRIIRYSLYLIAAVQVVFAAAFFWQMSWATRLWPFEGTTPLTYIFIASIFAAAAASTLWAAASRQYAALTGIGLDYLTILAPLSLYAFLLGARQSSAPLTTFGVFSLVGVLFGLWLTLWSVRFPMDRSQPMPRLVRGSFMVFVVALVIVGVRLLFQVPNVIPWTITPELSVVIGLIFLGAAVYFGYGLLRPAWVNSAGQLAGFLAYDVVLIVPFLTRLPTVAPDFRLSLVIYTTVVIYSGLLAGYYLFLARVRRRGEKQVRILGRQDP